jgi:two-component system alkaline phosphatase synthesis response regulator PhoP
MEHVVLAINPSSAANPTSEPDVYDDGFLRIEHDSYYVSCNGTVLFLPRKEFLILSRLARNVDRIVPQQALWEYAWGEHEPLKPATLRVYIYHLRKKLLPFGLSIKRLISVGYRLCAPVRQAGER